MGKDLAASAAAWAPSLVVTSPTWASPVSLPGLLRSFVPQPFLGLAFYVIICARQAWLPRSSPLIGAGTTVPCPGPSGTEGDMWVPVGGSRCSEPARGLRQDPALSVTSAPAFPFWVVKARAVNMHSGRGRAGLSRDGPAPRRALVSPALSTAGLLRRPALPPVRLALALPQMWLPRALCHLPCTHSPHPPDSGLGEGALGTQAAAAPF